MQSIELDSGSSTPFFQVESAFVAAINAAGLEFTGPIVADGGLQRFKVNGDKAKNSWYVLHTDGLAAGRFGCNKRGIDERWCIKSAETLTDDERAERDRRWKQQQQEREADRQRKQHCASLIANAILDAAQPATDDHPYLIKKAVKAAPGLMVGVWAQCRRDNCLLIPLRTPDGQLATIEAISPDAPFHHGKNKDFLKGGAKQGAYFVIGDLVSSPVILIAEGYSTAATLHEATGHAAVMACDTNGLTPVTQTLKTLYPHPKIILICADNDRTTEGNPGVKAARAAAKKAGVRLAIPEFAEDEAGSDFNDLAALHGLDRVWNEIESALAGQWKAGKESKESQPRAKAEQDGARLATITLTVGEYPEATDKAELHLIAAEAGIFQRGCLVRISREKTATVRGINRPVGAALIAALSATYLRDLLERVVAWQHWDSKIEDYKRCNMPHEIALRLLSRAGMWQFPMLNGVVTAPTLRPDGSLIIAAGYDAATGLFLDFQGEQFPAIPEQPTPEQGKAALALLVREVLENRCIGDAENTGFAFASPAAKAAALSAILTALVRHTVPKAPLHLFSACRAGSGKSLLADAVALIATGKTATILDLAEDGDEQEKRLLSVFMAGDSVINLDNVERPLGGAHLNKALTAEQFTGRVLGLSQNATVPTTATWLATGNNVIVKEDMTRRVVICQLDPQTESPEKREFERNLEEWIPANRPALAMAALTALRSYIVAGKPKQSIPIMGSFEDWHRLVRSALVWLGESDPLGDTGEMEGNDPTRIRLRALIFAWHNAFKAIPTTAKEAVARANSNIRDENGDEVPQDSLLRDALADHFTDGRKGAVSSRLLGDFLSKIKGRIECGAKFEQAGKSHSAQLWRLNITDPSRFETEKGELGESGESVRSRETKNQNSSKEERNSHSENVKNKNTNFRSGGGSDSPDSPNSPDSPATGENWGDF